MKTKLTLFILIFYATQTFSQTRIYKSEPVVRSTKDEDIYNSITMVGNAIIVNMTNYRLRALSKNNYETLWEIQVGLDSNTSPYFYKDSFFYATKKGERSSMAQYDVKTGKLIKELPFESIWSKPFYVNGTMYFTGLMDGAKMLAYDIDQNQIVWEKQLGMGTAQTVYLKDKIILDVEDKQWTEMDYNGKQIPSKSKKTITIDSTEYNVDHYEFPTHDGKEITEKFLRRKKVSGWDFTKESTEKHTVLLDERRLLIIGKGRKVVLNLDLETLVSPDLEDYHALRKIVKVGDETIWIVYQNHLIHYDFKNKKLLRDVSLSNWKPYQLILDERTIWLISSNDGQLYALDFESDGAVAEKMAREKAIENHYKCNLPDQEKIDAAKEIQKKLKTN
ncbi:outer membrane protein assembly factor BamB family protein [Epilithonimonas lactis]|uniref:Pyrrolo-quinoline quinone repeat domain-containing protein n=1 Tax=Epilithonimonas lactis TaxID=421072 RepID=A0A085BHK8_9FLAO|nr:PQQ-binding-like beta-propeller repeat protein [Epilithonimonas lactis]KFC21953.1 hypothetical protein IO89_08250 [Epilithonimonas lactis]